jgi:hypothetical protein
MVRIYGSDIPNLSHIVDDAFESIEGIVDCGNCSIEVDPVDTDMDIAMNDEFDDYTIDALNDSSEE